MTRSQFDSLSAGVVRSYMDMEDEILKEIAAQLVRDGDISDTSKWRMRQLARAGRLDKRVTSVIRSYTGFNTSEMQSAIERAALTETQYLDDAVRDLAAKGIHNFTSDVPAEDSALNAAKAFQNQAKNDLNMVNTVMRYKAGSSFVRAVGEVYDEANRQQALNVMNSGAASVVMGQRSLQEATRKTIHRLAQQGIPAFVDKRGHEWSPESYVMMDMRSTLANTARAAQNTRCDQYGIFLIQVDSHMGARPLCAPFQGRIFSRNGTRGVTADGSGGKIEYTPLSETSYGEPAGLFGVNCGHVQYPFFPGASFQSYFPYLEEENAERYKQFQTQRRLERNIRAAKRECMMLNETGDKEEFAKASLRLKNQRAKYREYCKKTGLAEHNDRTQVYGFDRSVSGKTVWAQRKNSGGNISGNGLTGGGGSAILKSVQTFNSKGDPMFEVTGSAYDSHPKEIQTIINTLREWGVEINETNTLGYGSPARGKPGGMSITPNASYSAWLHEFQHVKDAHDNGWDAVYVLYGDMDERIRREKKAYQIEIDYANKLNRPDIAKRLEENLNDEIRKINDFFGVVN